MLEGINHLTLAVSNIEQSIKFYNQVLGFRKEAKWDNGAYLTLGSLWLCLSLDRVSKNENYTHYAFTINETQILAFKSRLKTFKVKEWKNNTSEGSSIYFLDPDGHKLEVHTGNLSSRLAACRINPYKGMIFF